MPSRTQLLTASGFAVLLLLLGTTDAMLTANRIVLPTQLSADATGAAKENGTTVEQLLQQQGFVLREPTQQNLLPRIVLASQGVHAFEVFRDNDRIASLSWVETSDVKTYFQALKDALHASFSSQVQDLRDDTLRTDGPVVNVLTFLDPAISEERLFFLRVRKYLFEVHVASQKDADAATLIAVLSQ